MRRELALTERDVMLSVTTISFDIAALELYLPLTIGARVLLAGQEETRDGKRLASLIDNQPVTVMQATPATWKLLLFSGWQGRSGLRILCGGETLASDLAGALLRAGDSVWNLYGPTETTVWSTAWKVEQAAAPISIGRPIANTQVYILNGGCQPSAVGIPGELHIGGDGVARGYLKRADLTAEKFIPDPFTDEPGGRLYKTGDSARHLADGNIEFLGRIDHQVKIRGFRIELGEIETALRQHPAVRETVVLARDEVENPKSEIQNLKSADKRLVAYLVSDRQTPGTGELREFLKEKLPDYMVPSAFVMMDNLPLTPNGKIDRKALPAPDQSQRERDVVFTAPRTSVEESISEIWTEFLGVAPISVDDNFFDLGGHSIIATQVISRLHDVFQVALPLRAIFEAPTVSALAKSVETLRRCSGGTEVYPSPTGQVREEGSI
jgi:acyl-coenzyme A synthetase/AMP-(fatty) acid ligase/acyl carrier protein